MDDTSPRAPAAQGRGGKKEDKACYTCVCYTYEDTDTPLPRSISSRHVNAAQQSEGARCVAAVWGR